jgi:hypothetical protein
MAKAEKSKRADISSNWFLSIHISSEHLGKLFEELLGSHFSRNN